jgi:4-hydroxy-2-oxoheptanedioate aldolase
VGDANKEVIIAVQIETADSIRNIDEIAGVEGVDMLFLGQNDLCMSMGLFETYEFPKMVSFNLLISDTILRIVFYLT